MTKNIALIAALFAGSVMLPAHAALVLSVSPASQTVNLGDQVTINVVFSGLESDGLDEIVSAYDLSVSFDDSILAYSSGTYFDLIDQAPSPDLSISGVIRWDSAWYGDDATLQAQQGDSVTLGTLVFNTLSPGTSPFTFNYDNFDDLTGLNSQSLVYSTANGSATVAEAPLPPTIALLGLGVFGLAAARRRKAKP